MGGVSLVYEIDTWWMALLQITVPVGMTIAGTIVARNRFQQVCDTFEGGWQRFSDLEDDEAGGVAMNPMGIGIGRSLQREADFRSGEGDDERGSTGSASPTITSPPPPPSHFPSTTVGMV